MILTWGLTLWVCEELILMLPLCGGLTSALLTGTSFGQTYHISLISTSILHDEYWDSDALDFHTKAHTYTTAKFITVQHDLSNPGIKPRSPALQGDSLPSEPPWKPSKSVDKLRHNGLVLSSKGNNLLTHATTGMNPRNMMVKKRNQIQKTTCVISSIRISREVI